MEEGRGSSSPENGERQVHSSNPVPLRQRRGTRAMERVSYQHRSPSPSPPENRNRRYPGGFRPQLANAFCASASACCMKWVSECTESTVSDIFNGRIINGRMGEYFNGRMSALQRHSWNCKSEKFRRRQNYNFSGRINSNSQKRAAATGNFRWPLGGS